MTTSTPPSSEDVGFVFVHGAGLDTWIWEGVASRLPGPTLSPSFPGRAGTQADRNGLRLADYVAHVREQVDDWDVQRIVLVGHSISGVVCLGVVRDTAKRVAGFVGLSGLVPTEGGSFLSCYPRRQRLAQWVAMRIAGTKPPDSVIRRSLCSGLTEAQTDRVVENFVPESRRLYTDRIEADVPDVPSLYLKTMRDETESPAHQDEMIANLGTTDVVEIDAGHMAMLSHPADVATGLQGFDADLDR